ncbi:hypothetical protein [Clostridium sp. 'White wine YQ']|uniref:hypothetical protein n=1 Tax=Clostridium sp. 'White wine YQ' TaxID=3027474 RepID=UPI002365CE78|nr:hypothetical protein [Clostridium sp. 'White wine YQ']MDD7794273.1 hypothetical protein [Clostridium sp. 'White wine YQ']
MISKKKKLLFIIITIIVFLSAITFIAIHFNSIKYKEVAYIEIIQQKDGEKIILSYKNIIDKYMKALNDKKRTNKKLDISSPDYLVNINYIDKSKEEYNLWIGENDTAQGVLMKGSKVWFINKNSNIILNDILKNKVNTISLEEVQDIISSYLNALTQKDLEDLKKYGTEDFTKGLNEAGVAYLRKTIKSAKLLNAKINTFDKDKVLIDSEVEIICYDNAQTAGDWIPGKSISTKQFELIKVEGKWKINSWGY